MNWRPLLAAFCGLLLPLPLVLAVGAWWTRPQPQPARDTRLVSPMLSLEERRALLTHERACQTSEDCEAPLGCLSIDWGQALCMASECLTDLQCEEGFTCKTLRTRGQGPRVRTCVVRGVAQEGAPCMASFTFTPEESCRPGLICNGYCGRPCQLGAPESCPEGTFCRDGKNGASCMPTCEGRSCAEGEECARFQGGFSVCARISGENCQRHACRDGTRCSVAYLPGRRGEVQMECVQDCGAEHPPCPEGTVCEQRQCRRPCERDNPSACGPKETCGYNPRTQRWLCTVRLSDGTQPP